jgi:hypothetical protein
MKRATADAVLGGGATGWSFWRLPFRLGPTTSSI